MKHFEEIIGFAIDRYGLITASEAKEMGVAGAELKRWCDMGRLTRLGQGVYKLVHYVPTSFDSYAEATTLVGEGAFLYGQSVLSMHNLALVDPAVTIVASAKRVRKTLPDWIKVVHVPKTVKSTFVEGIPSQSIADAIIQCKGSVMSERLIDGAKKALGMGLVTSAEYSKVIEVLEVTDGGTKDSK